MSKEATKELKLKADNPAEQWLLDQLKEKASEILIWKINAEKKTLAGAMVYCKKRAQETVEKGAGYAMVDDATVFGWVIHFFEEDEIEQPKIPMKGMQTPGKSTPAKKVESKPATGDAVIVDLFSGVTHEAPFA